MWRSHPAVAAVRLASAALAAVSPVRTVLVACSGGADSLALLAADGLRGPQGRAVRVVGVTVDHGLQEGSDRARRARGRRRWRRSASTSP